MGGALAEAHKDAEIASRTPEFMASEASKPFGWDASHFVDWATIEAMLSELPVPRGGSVVDVGCGSGWTSLFLAEAGYDVLGVDLVPANVDLCRDRAARWGSTARFAVADMDSLDIPGEFDVALLFDALHHSGRQRDVLHGVAQCLAPGGWLLIGEPTWLHSISPGARAVSRSRGWKERGLTLTRLKSDLRAAGFRDLRRFFQPTRPYEKRFSGFAWQLARLVSANLAVAPQAHYWVAAQKAAPR